MSIPAISEAIIRYNSNASSYNRGEEYYRNGAIAQLKKRGNLIQAEVEGSEITPYQVRISYDPGGITSAFCTCAYNYDGWCKHIVATLLECLHQSEKIEERQQKELRSQESGVRRNKNWKFQPVASVQLTNEYMGLKPLPFRKSLIGRGQNPLTISYSDS